MKNKNVMGFVMGVVIIAVLAFSVGAFTGDKNQKSDILGMYKENLLFEKLNNVHVDLTKSSYELVQGTQNIGMVGEEELYVQRSGLCEKVWGGGCSQGGDSKCKDATPNVPSCALLCVGGTWHGFVCTAGCKAEGHGNENNKCNKPLYN